MQANKKRASKFTLILSHAPNVDIDSGYWKTPEVARRIMLGAPSLKIAREMFAAWRDTEGFGCGNMTEETGTLINNVNGEAIGRFSYNGRFWSMAGELLISQGV
jgi:hypothetical protein